MALGALSLSVTQGVQGRRFAAKINGLTTGKVEVLGYDGSPGFSTVNGMLYSSGLPYPVSTVVLREYLPGVGTGYLDTRIDITAATPYALMQQAQAAVSGGRALKGYRVAGTVQGDGSIGYSLYVGDDLGATTVQAVGTTAPALAKFAAAIARVKAGTGRAIIADIGDSVTAGVGSSVAVGDGSGTPPSGKAATLRQMARPHQTVAMWRAAGILARSDALWCNMASFDSGACTQYTSLGLDTSMVSVGANWSFVSGGISLGGNFFRSSNPSTDSLVYQPEYAADRFDIYYLMSASTGNIQVSDQAKGTIYATINSQGTPATLGKTTVTRAANDTSPISIQRGTGTGNIAIVGIVPYSSTTPMLEIWNMGYSGSKTGDWLAAGSNYSPFNALDALTNVDLFNIVLSGGNDRNQGVPASMMQSNLLQLATKCKGLGDVQLTKSHKAASTGSPYYTTPDYLAAVDAVAASLALPSPINVFDNVNLGVGDYYDGIHLAAQGYGKVAAYMQPRLQASAGY